MLTSSAEPLRWCAHSANGYDRNVDLKPFAKMCSCVDMAWRILGVLAVRGS